MELTCLEELLHMFLLVLRECPEPAAEGNGGCHVIEAFFGEVLPAAGFCAPHDAANGLDLLRGDARVIAGESGEIAGEQVFKHERGGDTGKV